ncbi:MAG: hypothetical protein MRZ79_00035 [Bacteroidia bacterium]|nr:hypothetical protein [Bacteroidia bacterium]
MSTREGIYLNLKARMEELPIGRVNRIRQKLYEAYDVLRIANKFNRWKKIFVSETHTEKMYGLEAKALCDELNISLEQLYDPTYSFLDAHMKLRDQESRKIADRFGLKKAS